MKHQADGVAIVYCQGAFGSTNGKTAHGLVRRTHRYRILAVIDAKLAGKDASQCLGDQPSGIRIVGNLDGALALGRSRGIQPTHFAIGLAPDGGRLPKAARADVLEAIDEGLNIDSGLHDFLSDDPEIAAAALRRGVSIRDVRKPPPRHELHFFSGKIEQVDSLKVALLGTDSAVGKRTTAWLLVDALVALNCSAELVGTGQTAWMQGVRYGIVLDSIVSDFVAGEIEHAVWSAWNDLHPEVLVLEGQGSLMNPAYPGGFELLAAGRPDVVVLQHAPARREYDGFPGYPLHPLATQIEAIELISGKPVVAITINGENLSVQELDEVCRRIEQETSLPTIAPLRDGCERVARTLLQHSSDPARSRRHATE